MPDSLGRSTKEELDNLIVEYGKDGDLTIRNALMELRGLRAVVKMSNPAIMKLEDGTKMVIRD